MARQDLYVCLGVCFETFLHSSGVNPTKKIKDKKCLELNKAPGKKTRLWKILPEA